MRRSLKFHTIIISYFSLKVNTARVYLSWTITASGTRLAFFYAFYVDKLRVRVI